MGHTLKRQSAKKKNKAVKHKYYLHESACDYGRNALELEDMFIYQAESVKHNKTVAHQKLSVRRLVGLDCFLCVRPIAHTSEFFGRVCQVPLIRLDNAPVVDKTAQKSNTSAIINFTCCPWS